MDEPKTLAEFREFDKNPDPLVQAKLHYRDANTTGYPNDARLAQAAALIALAERKPQFIEVDERVWINPRDISSVTAYEYGVYDPDVPVLCVKIVAAGSTIFELEEEKAATFLRWWNTYADTVRLEAE